MHTFIHATGQRAHVLLKQFGESHTLLHVMILHKLEHDVALRRVGVIAHIMLLIVFLHEDDRVLTLCHIEVCLCAVRASVSKGVGFEAA